MSHHPLLSTGIVALGTATPVDGDGVRLRLQNGRTVIDASSTSAALGHKHPRIVKAVARAVRASPTLDEGWSTQMRESAAAELLGTAFASEEWVGAVRFALTGSEANDLALSLSQALTGRSALVARERAYHGMVGLARAVTTQPQWHGGLTSKSGAVRPVPPGAAVRTIRFPRGRMGDGLELSDSDAHEVLAGADATLAGAAAVIMDYTQGGCYAAPAYQDVLARKARRAGTLWIADEVVTGFGKCGRWFNFQRGNERPDLVTLGKCMGGGIVAAAAVVLSKEVVESIDGASWQNYSALRSTDLTAAAVREIVRVIAEDGLVARAERLHDVIRAGMTELASTHPGVSRIDGRGLHWWIELGDTDWRTWHGDEGGREIATRVASRVLDAGALVATSGERNVLLVSLPLIVSDDEVQLVLAALDHGLHLADREAATGDEPCATSLRPGRTGP